MTLDLVRKNSNPLILEISKFSTLTKLIICWMYAGCTFSLKIKLASLELYSSSLHSMNGEVSQRLTKSFPSEVDK